MNWGDKHIVAGVNDNHQLRHRHHNKKHQRGQYVQLAGTDYGTGKDSYDYLYDDEVVSVRAKKATEQKEAAKVKKAAEWTDLYN